MYFLRMKSRCGSSVLGQKIVRAEDIEKWREYKNIGAVPIELERVNSGEFTLASEGWKIINSNGTWADDLSMKKMEKPYCLSSSSFVQEARKFSA